MRWNRESLFRACESLLSRQDTQVRLRTIKDPNLGAHGTYHWTKNQASEVLITIDPAKSSLVEACLHEALHAVLQAQIGQNFNPCLEEAIIQALEKDLWKEAFSGRKRTERWRKIINAKLP